MTNVSGFPPIVVPTTRVLVLGSMPGIASLTANQYYAHPRNAFWPMIERFAGIEPNSPYPQRLAALSGLGIGLWDVIGRCSRVGSLDSAIASDTVIANDFSRLFAEFPAIRALLFNGTAAERLFLKHVAPTLSTALAERFPNPARQRLPSTSPAHAAMSVDEKFAVWSQAIRTTTTQLG